VLFLFVFEAPFAIATTKSLAWTLTMTMLLLSPITVIIGPAYDANHPMHTL
jgi:hypothetical protein